MEFILIIFGTSILVAILLLAFNSIELDVPIAVAGKINQVNTYNRSMKYSPFNVYVHNWRIITFMTHCPVIVGGDSMEEFGLKKGDLVLVRKLNSNQKSKLKEGDNILINVKDLAENKSEKEMKFRHFERFSTDNYHIIASTWRNGRKYSNDKHIIDNVIGKVEYKIS